MSLSSETWWEWVEPISSSHTLELNSLSHNQDTIHAEKGCAGMHDFHIAALMFLTGHRIKARTYTYAEITRFPMRCTIRTWKALSLQPRASQALMMHVPHWEMCDFPVGMGSCYNPKDDSVSSEGAIFYCIRLKPSSKDGSISLHHFLSC